MNPDHEFLEYVIKSLVDNPDDVQINRKVDEMGVLLTLKVHPDDMGGIIGKGGSTARALRTLLRVVGAKNNARVNLKIEEPDRDGESASAGPNSGSKNSSSNDSGNGSSDDSNDDSGDDSQSVDDAIEELKM